MNKEPTRIFHLFLSLIFLKNLAILFLSRFLSRLPTHHPNYLIWISSSAFLPSLPYLYLGKLWPSCRTSNRTSPVMQRGTHKDLRKHVIFALYLLAYTTSSFPPPSRPYTFLASFFPSSYLPSFASYLQLYLLFTSFIPWLIPQWGDDAAYIALLHFTLWTMLGEIQILNLRPHSGLLWQTGDSHLGFPDASLKIKPLHCTGLHGKTAVEQ